MSRLANQLTVYEARKRVSSGKRVTCGSCRPAPSKLPPVVDLFSIRFGGAQTDKQRIETCRSGERDDCRGRIRRLCTQNHECRGSALLCRRYGEIDGAGAQICQKKDAEEIPIDGSGQLHGIHAVADLDRKTGFTENLVDSSEPVARFSRNTDRYGRPPSTKRNSNCRLAWKRVRSRYSRDAWQQRALSQMQRQRATRGRAVLSAPISWTSFQTSGFEYGGTVQTASEIGR